MSQIAKYLFALVQGCDATDKWPALSGKGSERARWRGDVITFREGEGHFAAEYDWQKGRWFLRLQQEGMRMPSFAPDRGYRNVDVAVRWLWVAEFLRQQDAYRDDGPWPHPDRGRR